MTATVQGIDDIERDVARRFSRFSSAAFADLVERAAVPLAARVALRGDWSDADKEQVLRGFVRLGAEAVGLGYVYEDSGPARSFFTWAFGEILPDRLPRLATPRAALEELTRFWNLGEGLAHADPIVERLVWLARQELATGSLEGFVGTLEARLSAAGVALLDSAPDRLSVAFLSLAGVSRWALPGRVRFRAPRIVEVEERSGGQSALIYLQPSPVLLGVLAPDEAAPWPQQPSIADALWATLCGRCRTGALLATLRSPHFAVAVPELSQRVFFAWAA